MPIIVTKGEKLYFTLLAHASSDITDHPEELAEQFERLRYDLPLNADIAADVICAVSMDKTEVFDRIYHQKQIDMFFRLVKDGNMFSD
ncbi:uncharacterized protein BO97DRAFT_424962 [Aspergillus homomorphus CBS 101889]|uniref:Uncharacterized protein n=1 Tax=Aspergillus homomorphus (strain CBS 101889) TaxID=1450537 RepID=A0A395HW63_ASPHC|nr:hypothetical protein BO97DRAFT_424962 [Aspergillus homomorphus CBS 101889]RAL12037.1 hypothetical protein BO97DRAFT_424962 [Aspergillus homomorphus CBS 101889]